MKEATRCFWVQLVIHLKMDDYIMRRIYAFYSHSEFPDFIKLFLRYCPIHKITEQRISLHFKYFLFNEIYLFLVQYGDNICCVINTELSSYCMRHNVGHTKLNFPYSQLRENRLTSLPACCLQSRYKLTIV